MRKLVGISIALILFSGQLFAQEVRLGLVGGTNLYQNIQWDTSSYSPTNSYYTYLESSNGRGLINSHSIINGINVGAILNFSYKRFSFNLEPQYYYSRTVLRFESPYELSRIIGVKSFRMPFYFTYKFFKKENSSFLILGLCLNKGRAKDIQNPGGGYYLGDQELYDQSLDFGDNHFENILYDDQGFTTITVGLGKQFKKMSGSFRYIRPLKKDRFPAITSHVELSINWLFLSTRDFTKKHFLYVE